MNRYPLWKSLLFAGVMLLALVLALPNVFGEAPALQLSRKDGELFAGPAAGQPCRDRLDEARTALQAVDPNVTLTNGTSATGASMITTTLSELQVRQRQDFAIQQNITALGNRVNSLGVSEASVQRTGANRIAVQLPGIQDASEVIRLLGKTATLEFRMVEQTGNPVEAAQTGHAPLGTKLYKDRSGRPVLLKREVIVTGEQLTDATSTFQQGEPAVSLRLDGRGGEEMLRTTRENIGRPMAVVFIEREREMREQNGAKVAVDVTKEEVINVAT